MAELDLDAIKAKQAEHDAAPYLDSAWIARLAFLGEYVPALIAEVERLRTELEADRATLNLRTGQLQAARRHADEYRAERDVARVEVRQWQDTFGENALRNASAVLAERDAYRAQVERLTNELLDAGGAP